MKKNEAKAAVEAILFTMGEAVELERLASALDVPESQLQSVIEELMEDYKKDSRGIQIIKLENAYQMGTKASMYEYLVQIAHVPKKHVLTDVLLETLSIIAYKQPITKLAIENIRGVKSDHAVNKLVEYNLACEIGRLDAPGRPIVFGTTEEFLRNFGINSLEELPIVNSDKMESFKEQAAREAREQLGEEYPEENENDSSIDSDNYEDESYSEDNDNTEDIIYVENNNHEDDDDKEEIDIVV